MTSGKTVLQETKMTANSYRTAQANAAANAAMDYATAYFMVDPSQTQCDNGDGTQNCGLDHDKDGSVDYTADANVPTPESCAIDDITTSAKLFQLGTTSTQKTYARFYFRNDLYDHDNDSSTPNDNLCNADNRLIQDTSGNWINMHAAIIIAQGWSDDCSATRTLTQCVTVSNGSVLKGNGPEQPFVSKGDGLSGGNAKIINRYTNTSIWTGGVLNSNGASTETYSRTANTEISDNTFSQNGQLDKTVLENEDESLNTLAMSNNQNGIGIDVITEDPNLGTISDAEFFDLFFKDLDDDPDTDNKQNVKDVSNVIPSGSDIDGLQGLIWVEGTGSTTTLNGGTVGSVDSPAILIVEGDLRFVGTTKVYGVIYVIGELFIAGNTTVVGSVITEVTADALGTLRLVYSPFGNGDGNLGTGAASVEVAGSYTVVNGSWKDW